jgi:ABC-type xylose transport system permease subunit
MRHALILGGIGFVLSTLGAIIAITMADLGPAWYPIALALTALPCAWVGGALHRA